MLPADPGHILSWPNDVRACALGFYGAFDKAVTIWNAGALCAETWVWKFYNDDTRSNPNAERALRKGDGL